MNAKISINNSTVIVYECDNHAKNARDELLRKLFHARHKATMGASPIGRNCSTTITVANMKR